MILDIIKACFAGPIPYRIFSFILVLLIIFWICWGLKIIKPIIGIYLEKKIIINKPLVIEKNKKYGRYMIPFDSIYIKNIGFVPIKNISIKINLSEEVQGCSEIWETPTTSTTTSGAWLISNSPLDGYVSLLTYNEHFSLNLAETWNRRYKLMLDFSRKPEKIKSIYGKLHIYYGLDKPIETDIIFRLE